MTIGFYAGSFDPITYGHLEVIRSAFVFCKELIIAIGENNQKTPLFSAQERRCLIEHVLKQEFGTQTNPVKVIIFNGLAIDAACSLGANLLIRGLRSYEDVSYEMQMADVNAMLCKDLPTVFIPAPVSVRAISSSMVKIVAAKGGKLDKFVPPLVAESLRQKQ